MIEQIRELAEGMRSSVESFRDIHPSKEYRYDELDQSIRKGLKKEKESVLSPVESPDLDHIKDIQYEKITTTNSDLEGKCHAITGVPFERQVIEFPDKKLEGVFAKFESVFDAKIPEELYSKSDKTQFRECNSQLADALDKNPDLKEKFSKEQLEQIRDGIQDGSAPDGYVWHHDAQLGKIQLVDSEIHSKTGHTGGRFVWGGGTANR